MAAADHIGEVELVALGIGAAVLFVLWKGGIANAAAAVAEAAVNAVANAASGATTGVVNAIGSKVGIPTTDELTDDPYYARWIIDQPKGGLYQASLWSTSSAYLNALTISAGGGDAPARTSSLWARFGDTSFDTIDMGKGTGW